MQNLFHYGEIIVPTIVHEQLVAMPSLKGEVPPQDCLQSTNQGDDEREPSYDGMEPAMHNDKDAEEWEEQEKTISSRQHARKTDQAVKGGKGEHGDGNLRRDDQDQGAKLLCWKRKIFIYSNTVSCRCCKVIPCRMLS